MEEEIISETDINTHRRVKKNAGWLFGGQIIGRILRAGIVIYSARILGVENWGAFSYALSLATFLTVFSDIGINALLTRESSRNQESRSSYLSTAFYIKLAMLTVLGIILYAFSNLITSVSGVEKFMPLIALVVLFDTMRDLGSAIARSLEKMRIEAVNNILTNAVIAIAGAFVLYKVPSGQNLMIAYAAGTGVGMLFIFISLKNHMAGIFTHFRKELIGKIISSAWAFGMLGLMGIITINTDVIILGLMRSVEEVGLYSAGQKIVQLLYLIPTIIATAYFPAFAKNIGNPERFRGLFNHAIGIIFMIAMPLTLGGVVLASPIIDLFYGPQYAAAAANFAILMLTIIMVFPAILIGNAIFAHDKHKWFVTYVLFGIFGNIALDIILIPIWGIEGSATATLLNQIIINLYAWWNIRKSGNLNIAPKLAKITAASAIMGICAFTMNHFGISVLLNIAISGVVYLSALYASKEESLYKLLELKR